MDELQLTESGTASHPETDPSATGHVVEVVDSSRHVRIERDGVILAETRRPKVLLETGLPARHYIPRADVRMDLFEPTDTSTFCPFKGDASYFSARIRDEVVADVAWTYATPIAERTTIAGLIAFFDEKVDTWLDGEQQPRPKTKWSS
jgi:uncharacterized protein (DUF427 family)